MGGGLRTGDGAAFPKGFRIALGPPRPVVSASILLAFLALIGLGLWISLPATMRPAPRAATAAAGPARPPATPSPGDASLYRRVIEDVSAGTPYYRAATQEQRRGGYPLRPFVAVRPPTLAVGLAALPNEFARRAVLAALALATMAVWARRLAGIGVRGLALAGAMIALVTGSVAAFLPMAYPFHELWAGLLIMLSIALRRPERWALAVLVGLLAALTRELAGAYLVAMAALAWKDGCRRETLAWLGALVVLAVALAGHAWAVSAQVLPGDAASQGWLKISGWRFVLLAVRWNTVLLASPLWVAALLTPPALLGLAAWRDPLGERMALTVFGYVAAFILIGRPENAYWGLLIAPLWPLGWLLAPKTLLMLLTNLKPGARQGEVDTGSPVRRALHSRR
jgi:hypothetical protein